jgi:hypothetical protein
MWDYVSDRESGPIWIKEALIAGVAIFSTYGSFQPHANATVSRAEWIITCTTARQILDCSFYKRSSSACSYRSKLLGLVAIHTLIMVLCTYYAIPQISGVICCDSKSALNKSSQKARRI